MGEDGKIILKRFFKKKDVWIRTGLSWLMIKKIGGLVWTVNESFLRRWEMSASQDELCLITYLLTYLLTYSLLAAQSFLRS